MCQIVGGVAVGRVSDRMGRRFALMVNMTGAGFAYFMVGEAKTMGVLILSRVIVGLVKHSETVAKALTADLTSPADRTAAMSHLNAAQQIGWFAGQFVGGMMSTRYGVSITTKLSSWLFLVNVTAVMYLIPKAISNSTTTSNNKEGVQTTRRGSLFSSIKMLFASRETAGAVFVLVLNVFIKSGLYSAKSFYLTERFSMTMEELGIFGGAQGGLIFLLSVFGIGPIVKVIGGEDNAILFCCVLSSAIVLAETLNITSYIYIFMLMPARTLLGAIVKPCANSNFVGTIPTEDRGVALSALDMLFSIATVLSPFAYGYVLDRYGFRWMLFGSAFLFAVVAVVQFAAHRARGAVKEADAVKKRQ